MFAIGHVGITAGLVHAYESRSSALEGRVDYRVVALLSVLPDLIDKPVGLLYPKFFGHHTRLFGHSLLIGLAVTAIMIAFSLRKRWGIGLTLCYFISFWMHDFLDRMWLNSLHYFFWPFFGEAEVLAQTAMQRWKEVIFTPYTLGGEVVGFLSLTHLFVKYKLLPKTGWKRIWKTGKLAAQPRFTRAHL